jgi:hypothetical protein
MLANSVAMQKLYAAPAEFVIMPAASPAAQRTAVYKRASWWIASFQGVLEVREFRIAYTLPLPPQAPLERLRRVEKRSLGTSENPLVAAISRILASNAEWGPWHGLQASLADIPIAVNTVPEAIIINSTERKLDVAPDRGVAVQTYDGKFPV